MTYYEHTTYIIVFNCPTIAFDTHFQIHYSLNNASRNAAQQKSY